MASALTGLDVTMPGDGLKWADGKSLWGSELTRAVLNGSVPVERVNDMVTRVVAAWYQLGQDDTSKWPLPPPDGEGGLVAAGAGAGGGPALAGLPLAEKIRRLRNIGLESLEKMPETFRKALISARIGIAMKERLRLVGDLEPSTFPISLNLWLLSGKLSTKTPYTLRTGLRTNYPKREKF